MKVIGNVYLDWMHFSASFPRFLQFKYSSTENRTLELCQFALSLTGSAFATLPMALASSGP